MGTRKISLHDALLYVLLMLGSLLMVCPFLYMFLSAFKSNQELMTYPPTLFPKSWDFGNFARVWNGENNFSVYFKNSIFLSVVRTALVLYTSALVGYVLGKLEFKGRQAVFYLVLATMMIPWPVTIIPLYQEMVWFGWLNGYSSIIIPFAMNSFGIFLMKQFMDSIPFELIEASRLDGASEIAIFHKIIIPLIGPALSALAIFIFIWTWDDFLWPFLMLTDAEKYTLPIGLAIFQGKYWTDLSSVLAGASIATIPVVIVYVIFQKRIIEGITLTGLK